jgi:hypothetical protein
VLNEELASGEYQRQLYAAVRLVIRSNGETQVRAKQDWDALVDSKIQGRNAFLGARRELLNRKDDGPKYITEPEGMDLGFIIGFKSQAKLYKFHKVRKWPFRSWSQAET